MSTQASDNWERFGRWVATCRDSKGLTQDQLGELVGLDRQQIYRIEKGASTKRATVLKIAEALDADNDYALSLAFGAQPKDTEQLIIDRAAEAADAAELIENFLTLPPEQRTQILAMIRVLRADHPELLEMMKPPIKIVKAEDLTESDVEIAEDTG